MNLKDFISKTISDIVKGLEISSDLTGKEVGLYSVGKTNQRHIEFDVAVVAENKNKKNGGGGIKVLEMLQVNGEKATEKINSTVSRVKFGVRVK